MFARRRKYLTRTFTDFFDSILSSLQLVRVDDLRSCKSNAPLQYVAIQLDINRLTRYHTQQVPYFNAPIYLQNKTSIGKVDEILGPINQVFFTIKTSEGVQPNSFQTGDKVYIAGDKLLPLERFLPKPKPPPGTKGKLAKYPRYSNAHLSSLAHLPSLIHCSGYSMGVCGGDAAFCVSSWYIDVNRS